MRHVPAGNDWHTASDLLTGSHEEYGDPADDGSEWSVKFDATPFARFLFAYGDHSKWLLAERYQVIGEFYEDKVREIIASSQNPRPSKAIWRRKEGEDDGPLISIYDSTLCVAGGSRCAPLYTGSDEDAGD